MSFNIKNFKLGGYLRMQAKTEGSIIVLLLLTDNVELTELPYSELEAFRLSAVLHREYITFNSTMG